MLLLLRPHSRLPLLSRRGLHGITREETIMIEQKHWETLQNVFSNLCILQGSYHTAVLFRKACGMHSKSAALPNVAAPSCGELFTVFFTVVSGCLTSAKQLLCSNVCYKPARYAHPTKCIGIIELSKKQRLVLSWAIRELSKALPLQLTIAN